MAKVWKTLAIELCNMGDNMGEIARTMLENDQQGLPTLFNFDCFVFTEYI